MTTSAGALELIQSVEQADSPSRLVAAVRALAEARLEAGIPTLITVLGYNNPEAAVAAVEGLVYLGDVSVAPLLEQLDDYNYGARAYSFRALAAIADPRALDVLLSAAEADFAPSVRRAAAKGLGNLRWVQLPAEQRQLAQERALKTLLLLSNDPEWAIRYAAVVGLQGLAASEPAANPDLVEQVLARFAQIAQTDIDLAVRGRVLMAQEQLSAIHTQLSAHSY
ncbi:MAG TPA: HEAT repeat domain-containing protein [Coleofasciculaceae cyanobacterium]